jgi:hypothetical protein
VVGENLKDPIFNFTEAFLELKPDILVSTEDDRYPERKAEFAKKHGAKYVQLSKNLHIEKISTTEIRKRMSVPAETHLRVDFAGGWLDVPKYSKKGAYVVNCSIVPKVALNNWVYKKGSGLGGSAAYSMLMGDDSVFKELKAGVGWQDPAVILESGLCVWRSGKMPVLETKVNPDFLNNKMGLFWTGHDHNTPSNTDRKRDYKKIELAGGIAYKGVINKDIKKLCKGIDVSYKVQLLEGMQKLPSFGEMAKKYCGGGHGGYALYVFNNERARNKFLKNPETMAIEPYISDRTLY